MRFQPPADKPAGKVDIAYIFEKIGSKDKEVAKEVQSRPPYTPTPRPRRTQRVSSVAKEVQSRPPYPYAY